MILINLYHLFFTCPIAKAIWIVIANCFGDDNTPTNLEQCWTWCDKWFQNGKKHHAWGVSAICWAIWKARNKACFDDCIIKNPIEIVCHAGVLMSFWTGLYEKVDKEMLINGVNTMLRVAVDLLTSKDSNEERKRLKYGESAD